MTTITIHQGQHRGRIIENESFDLVRPYKMGVHGGYVTVRDTAGTTMRVKVHSHNDYTHEDSSVNATARVVETDQEIMDRIEERFNILEEMTRAAMSSDIRAMIVVGPPGVGKSFGVERELEKGKLFDTIAGLPPKYTVVKGALTAIGLYSVLYQYSEANNVVVFDDCDGILQDELSLNLLKAALDSGKRRRICWNSDSYMLRREGIPDSFDFKGSVIFITNLNLENIKSKKLQDHLEALQSRCHYLDLTISGIREKILRIKQIHRSQNLFNSYDFEDHVSDSIIEFMEDNKGKFRELSLRTALKIADLVKMNPINWQKIARVTCMTN